MPEKGRPEVRIVFPDDLKEFIGQHKEGTYLLLDVRQPEEYEQAHLPGSRLIPLPELPRSLGGLDRRKETIVYCAVGGRSLAAARFLAVRGFEKVMQLQGGIEAWEDTTASGPVEFHLRFIRGDETAIEAARMAYGFEDGLERFHAKAMGRTDSPAVRGLLEKLVQAEENHKKRLLDLLKSLGSGPNDSTQADIMEGGVRIDEFLEQNAQFLDSVLGCVELAMMIETQALDLYLRMADACTDAGAREVFLHIGEEEKNHLASLGDLLGQEYAAAGKP